MFNAFIRKPIVKLFFFLGTAMPCYVNAQKIEFNNLEINYGNMEKDANGIREFKFINSGSAPLIIMDAKASCGCVVPSYPKEPIMPGASGVIKVQYDTKRPGPFTKYVTLTTNSVDATNIRLSIKGNVSDEPGLTPGSK